MRRGWNVVRDRTEEGSERSLELATALAQTSDPDFLEQVVHAKALLDAVGGQVFIAAVRNKYAVITVRDRAGNVLGEQREVLEDRKQPGEYETDAYLFHFDHIATALRDAARQPDSEFPAEGPAEVEIDAAGVEPEEVDELEAELELADEVLDPVAAETAELNQNAPGDSVFEGG